MTHLRAFLFAYAKAHAYPYASRRALACAFLRAARAVRADAVVSQAEAHEHAAAVTRAVNQAHWRQMGYPV